MRDLARAAAGTLAVTLCIHVAFRIAVALGITSDGDDAIRMSAHVAAVLLTVAWILAPSWLPAAYSVTLPVSAGVAQLTALIKRGAILYGSLAIIGAIILVFATRYAVVRFRVPWEDAGTVLGGLAFGVFLFFFYGGLEASWLSACSILFLLVIMGWSRSSVADA